MSKVSKVCGIIWLITMEWMGWTVLLQWDAMPYVPQFNFWYVPIFFTASFILRHLLFDKQSKREV